MILDRFGNEIPVVRMRRAIGFVPQLVVDEQSHDVDAPRTPAVRLPLYGDQADDPPVA